jgi:tetratricopeptide (TPR) repeat protein
MFCPACATPLSANQIDCSTCGRPAAQSPLVDAPSSANASSEVRAHRQRRHRQGVVRALYLVPLLILLIGMASAGARAITLHRAEGDAYRLAEYALAEGRLIDAERLFVEAGNYADAPARATAVRRLLEPYAAWYNDGVLALGRGDFDAAIDSLLPVARDVPDFQQATFLLEQARNGQAEALLSDADRAIAQGDWNNAERLLIALASENPDDPEIAAKLLELQREHATYVFTLNRELYIGNLGSDDPTLVTSAVSASWPVWSPDRSQIAFIVPGDQRNAYVRSLYVINSDGSELRKLADEPARWRAPVWSPDGTKIAFEVDGPGDGDPTGVSTVNISDFT